VHKSVKYQIAVVVSSYNRSHKILRLLEMMETQSLNRELWEFVICVDGSSDDSMKVLASYKKDEDFNLKYFEQKNQGQCIGRHNAILKSEAKYIVVIDDDMEFSESFLQSYYKAFQTNARSIIIGRVAPRDNWQSYPLYEAMREQAMSETHDALSKKEKLATGTHFITQNVAFPRDYYIQIGGFDAQLRLYEDCELGWRFEKDGADFLFLDKAVAVHHSDIGSFSKWKKRQYDYGTYAVYVWRKFDEDIHLHPLRNYLTGNKLYRVLFSSVAWSNVSIDATAIFLQYFSAFLSQLGFLKPALLSYRALQNLLFNRGVQDTLGRKNFNREIKLYKTNPNSPKRPLGEGSVFK
jgi:glycosyltransferase involved in cell wall biosynthesis